MNHANWQELRKVADIIWMTHGIKVDAIHSLIAHYGGGRKSKLKNKELDELKEILSTKESWLIKDVEKIWC